MDQREKFENLIFRQTQDRREYIDKLDKQVRDAAARHGRAAMLKKLLGKEEAYAEHMYGIETMTLASMLLSSVYPN